MFQGKSGQVALDQIRAVDRDRLIQRLGTVTSKTAQTVSSVLVEMFGREV
jgi:mRNA interferase MazF